MPKKEYIVKLTKEEKSQAKDIVRNGRNSSRKIMRANILLLTDDNRERQLSIREIATLFNVSPNTVQAVRREYVKNGFEATINRKERISPPIKPKITEDVEAKIIALSRSTPPKGYFKWTLRMLADKAVELGIIDSISHVSINDILKKQKSQ